MQASSQGETIQFRIPADVKYVPMIRRAVQSIASSLGFSEEISLDIELSVAEAVSNAIEHGSPKAKVNVVVVTCGVRSENLVIDVRDEGTGFELPDAALQLTEVLDERGRGLRLIYQLMDNVKVHRTSRGTRIRMVKKNTCLEKSPTQTPA